MESTTIGWKISDQDFIVSLRRTAHHAFFRRGNLQLNVVTSPEYVFPIQGWYGKFASVYNRTYFFESDSLGDILREIEKLEANGFHITEEFKTKILPQIMADMIGGII
jgi:hypothetical protein